MDDYLDSVESPTRALLRSKKSAHLLHLGGLKLTKFVGSVPDLADRSDGLLNPLNRKSSFHPSGINARARALVGSQQRYSGCE